jgi:hypothetical protein
MAITLTGTAINFPVGTQEKAASGFVLGFTQEWQNVTSSRALLTTYTNNTGRPIQVFIRMAGSTSNALVFRVDGVDISVTSHNGGSGTSCVSCIVPTGSTYSISNGAWPLGFWHELRV